MKATLKKIVKISISLILIFWVINTAKNIYLYFTYEHGNLALVRVEGKPGEIEGRWRGVIDSWTHIDDRRHIKEYIFNSDGTGIYYTKTYSKRITGKSSKTYSWGAILPFDKKDYYEHSYKILIDSLYITFLPDTNAFWYGQDTAYTLYKISNDSLYIDIRQEEDRYTAKPIWLYWDTEKFAFKKMFIPYLY
ncbi:MAG: hypothetical protein U9O95_05185 [Candidatus Marinimicrobia bacterium]|nr:hypothetical protein [Candidatus Neomarinimicrobiota bacterium]